MPGLQPRREVLRLGAPMLFFKVLVVLGLIPWTLAGIYLFARFQKLFGPDRGQPSETPGARSFGMTHVFAVWVGGMALGIYFAFFVG